MLYDVLRQFFPNILVYGPPIFRYRAKMGLRKVAGGYKKPYETRTTQPKRLKFILKGSQKYTLDDP